MKSHKLTLSWRVGLPISRSDESFEGLRDLFLSHRDVVDEVAFFETVTHHLYLPLESIRETAELLHRRVAALKRDGIPSVGINVLTTIGHINEGWDIMPPLPFQAMVGHDGSISTSCACPNTPEMRRYVADKYALFARANPDFIWVDDDIRMNHHGVAWGCFCPTCLRLFSKTVGRRFDRKSLVRAFNEPRNGALRAAWVNQNTASITSLMRDVEHAIHKENPKIKTGLMTAGPSWTTYSGSDFTRWMGALKAVKSRPGGGFYTDERPIDMVRKNHDTARQNAITPPQVTDRQYELENFPYAPLGKALVSLVNECTLSLVSGCNGIALNTLGLGELNVEARLNRERLMRRLTNVRPFWEQLVAQMNGCALTGFFVAWNPRLMARREVHKGEAWLGYSAWHDVTKPEVLAGLGLPLTMQRARGDGVILSGRVAEAFTDSELRHMLSGAVMMDAFALEVLTARGLGHLAGVRVEGWLDNGVAERLTNDELNAPTPNALRDIRSEFWGDPYLKSARLKPLAKGVRVLSVLETYLGERRNDACVTAFENSLGGRVVVFGHAPWKFVEVKRPQILNVADWAMRGKLPVMIRETVPVIPFARLSANRKRGAIVLLNSGLDAIPQMTVEVRAPATKVCLAAPGRKTVSLKSQKEKNGWSVTLRDLEPWQVVALLLG